jgi:hypothetical protein
MKTDQEDMSDVDDTGDDSTGGFNLKVFADLGIKLGTLADELGKRNRLDQARIRMNPRYIPIERMSSQATATDLVDFGGPEDGLIWTVKLLIAAQSPDPTVANVAKVYWSVGQRGALAATSLRAIMNAGLPAIQDFGSARIELRANQNLIANLSAIPVSPNNSIALVAVIEEERLWSAGQIVSAV